MSNRTIIDFDLFCALMGDCKAVEIDGEHLSHPEVYADEVLLTDWCCICRSHNHEIYIDHETQYIIVDGDGKQTTIELLMPVSDTIDLANMLK